MPGADWIPGVSQLKSAFQFVKGDFEGAAKTQENFFRECPGVSQVTSTVQLIAGDTEGALETQKRCLDTVNNVANATPIVGHVKGIAHHMVGDSEGGNRALNAATRSTVVIGTGAAAAVTTGGLGAIPAGLAAGAGYDIAASVATNKPQGVVKVMADNAVHGKLPDPVALIDAAVLPNDKVEG